MPTYHHHLQRIVDLGYFPCVSEVTLTEEESSVPYPPKIIQVPITKSRWGCVPHYFRAYDEASLNIWNKEVIDAQVRLLLFTLQPAIDAGITINYLQLLPEVLLRYLFEQELRHVPFYRKFLAPITSHYPLPTDDKLLGAAAAKYMELGVEAMALRVDLRDNYLWRKVQLYEMTQVPAVHQLVLFDVRRPHPPPRRAAPPRAHASS